SDESCHYFDFDQLVAVAERADSEQRARSVVASEVALHDLPRRQQILWGAKTQVDRSQTRDLQAEPNKRTTHAIVDGRRHQADIGKGLAGRTTDQTLVLAPSAFLAVHWRRRFKRRTWSRAPRSPTGRGLAAAPPASLGSRRPHRRRGRAAEAALRRRASRW